MTFEEFVERMSDNGCSNTVCYPQHNCFLPAKSIKLVDPQNPSEQYTTNQDYSHLLYCLDEENKTAIAYYGFFDKDFAYISKLEKDQEVEDTPLEQHIPYIKLENSIEYENCIYHVAYLYIRSTAWQIELSSQLIDIYIDKRPQSENALTNRFGWDMDVLRNVKVRFGNSINSCFINKDNQNFAESRYGGSLYSSDKKKLYHSFVGYPTYDEFIKGYYKRDCCLADKVEIIKQGALQGLKASTLTIPAGVRRIEEGTLKNCSIQEINFEGQLEYLGIDENLDSEIWINNSSNKVDITGFKDIRKEYDNTSSKQRFRFSAPEANTEPSTNGFIKLTRWHKSHRYYDSYEVDTVAISTDSIASYHPHPLPHCYNKEQMGTLILLMRKDVPPHTIEIDYYVGILVCETPDVIEKKISEA